MRSRSKAPRFASARLGASSEVLRKMRSLNRKSFSLSEGGSVPAISKAPREAPHTGSYPRRRNRRKQGRAVEAFRVERLAPLVFDIGFTRFSTGSIQRFRRDEKPVEMAVANHEAASLELV
jgi:hypothetical protein